MTHKTLATAIPAAALAAALFAPSALANPPRLLDQLERALQATARKVAPSVVTIEVSRIEEAKQPGARRAPTRRVNPFQQLMRQFLGGMRRTHKAYYKRPQGTVTGYIARADGLIMTSWYNIGGKVDGIRVTLADGRRLPAKLLGVDKMRDVAMLKVEAKGLPALKPASEGSDPAIGSFVVVVNRSSAKHGMSWGIVSATTRDRGTTLQVDARTNYGNAGGPVVDLRGRLLGQVSKIAHWNRFGVNSGVSYAAKSSYVAKIFDKLVAGEEVKGPKRPLLGINGQDQKDGVQVTQVTPGGAAGKAGMSTGDVLTHFNGKKVTGIMQLIGLINRCKVGQKVKVKILRGGENIELDVVLGERKEGQ